METKPWWRGRGVRGFVVFDERGKRTASRTTCFGRSVAFALAASLVLAVLPRPAQGCFCDCYFSSDCGILSWCVYNKCIRKRVNGKLKDGECKFLGLLFAAGDIPNATQALDLWLQAYETSASGAGGPPDATLVAAAQGVPLTSDQHEVIRQFAIAVQEAYLGLTSYSDPEEHQLGFFTPPTISTGADCASPFASGDHGSVSSLDACHLAVGAKIRQAIIGEMQNPGMGEFAARMAEIPSECATYTTFGRCEFPHPDHGHPFPFNDGLECLEAELGRGVQSLLAGPTPTGACCKDGEPINECVDDVTEQDCQSFGPNSDWHEGKTCKEVFVDCPALSTLGMGGVVLLVLASGVYIVHRRRAALAA